MRILAVAAVLVVAAAAVATLALGRGERPENAYAVHHLVADGNGIVFLTTEPAWKFRTLRNLRREIVDRLAATRQYTAAGELERSVREAQTRSEIAGYSIERDRPIERGIGDRWRSHFCRNGAPRPMKMGTIVSLWHYDGAASPRAPTTLSSSVGMPSGRFVPSALGM